MRTEDPAPDTLQSGEQPASRLEWLIGGYFDGDLDDAERQELRRDLLSSPTARQEFWQMARLKVALHLWAGEMWGRQAAADESARASTPCPAEPQSASKNGRLPPMAATIAACAVCIGVGAGAAWALGPTLSPPFAEVFQVLREGFEKPLEPAPERLPFEPRSRLPATFGYWSGDRVAVSRGKGGVMPAEGQSMLVFEEALNAPLPPDTATARACDLYRLIDLRPYQRAAIHEQAVLRLSASFRNANGAADGTPAPSTRFSCRVQLFSGSIEDIEDIVNEWPLSVDREVARGCEIISLPSLGEAGGWQTVTTKALIPPLATFAIVHIAAFPEHDRGSDPSGRFPYRYPLAFCDDLRIDVVAQQEPHLASPARP